MSLHLSPTCLQHLSPTLVSHSGFLGPHEFTLVSSLSPTLGALGRMSLHLSPPCLPLWVPWAHEFTLSPTCLPLVTHLSPTLVSHTCLPHLSPTLGSLGHMGLHLSPPCLPLVSHSGCLGPHEFTLVSHLSPTLVSPLSPTLGALGRMR